MGKHYGLDIPTLRELRIDCDKDWQGKGITNCPSIVDRLSKLIIDADKDWQGKGITNVKEVAAAMAKGDIAVKTGSTPVLIRLTPGPAGYVLTSGGSGHLPSWMPAAGALEKWIGVWIELAHVEGVVTIDKTDEETAPLASEHTQAYLDAPVDYIRRLTPQVALADAEAIVTVDQTTSKTISPTRKYDLQIVVSGAVADDGGVQTDETAAAQNPTANDMTLLPAVPAVNDAYYFGHAKKFDVMILNIGTQGAGVWTIVWEYWNGTAWAALANLVDGTDSFIAPAGICEVTFSRPGDWALTTILTMNLHWIRARVSSYTSITTQPLGTQSWIRIIT